MSYEKEVKERLEKKFKPIYRFGTYDKHKNNDKLKDKTYSHIFKDMKHNFIEDTYPVKKCIKGTLTEENIDYNGARHLNSSQVMCISFFNKFFENETYEKHLLEILMKCGIRIEKDDVFTDAVFEYVPNAKEYTNFDFFLKLKSGMQISAEIKFTEKEFGEIKNINATYIKKFNDIYLDMIKNCHYNFPFMLHNSMDDKMQAFYKQYQINRNILYAKTSNDYVLFITPKANTELNEGRNYISSLATTLNTDRIRNIYWEDLIDITLDVTSNSGELYEYYKYFKYKYFE